MPAGQAIGWGSRGPIPRRLECLGGAPSPTLPIQLTSQSPTWGSDTPCALGPKWQSLTSCTEYCAQTTGCTVQPYGALLVAGIALKDSSEPRVILLLYYGVPIIGVQRGCMHTHRQVGTRGIVGLKGAGRAELITVSGILSCIHPRLYRLTSAIAFVLESRSQYLAYPSLQLSCVRISYKAGLYPKAS